MPALRIPRSLLLLAFWGAAMAVGILALLPATLPLPSTGWDKANHGLAFAVLGGLGLACWPQRAVAVLPGLLAYGIAIEVAQGFTATRSGEWQDALADALGLALVALVRAAARRLSQSGGRAS